jgi:uncharacterized YceG family protein
MAEPPDVKRYGRSAASRRAAALAGLLLGFGILVVIVWVVGARGDNEEAVPAPPAAAGTGAAAATPILKIVFPEGFTRNEMAARITEVNEIAEEERGIRPALSPKAYLRAANRLKPPAGFKGVKAPHLEGFLFPATYEFTEGTTSRELVEMQLQAFERAWGKLDLAYSKSKNLTPYDVLIIASMVEKEVQAPKERALVAAVIYNRLEARLPLGIDAAIRYGLDIPPTKAILQSQLDSDNPYNTRTHQGLPPTPIANPGLASLQAAAHPEDVDYLYFIRKADCKSHFFTANEQEFLDYPREGLEC